MRYSTMLRNVRKQAGLTQAQLAARIGIAVPVLSAYENGRREPKVDIFFRAVEAAGFDVEFVPEESALELRVPDAEEKSIVLARVCALGMALPHRDRGPLRYPPFRTLRVSP